VGQGVEGKERVRRKIWEKKKRKRWVGNKG
jgi:hypothetical protein